MTTLDRHHAPYPDNALYRAIERRYGVAARDELAAFHEQARQRYKRAAQLDRFRVLIARDPQSSGQSSAQIARMREAIENPEAYLAGDIPEIN
jgi:hypothetical protein